MHLDHFFALEYDDHLLLGITPRSHKNRISNFAIMNWYDFEEKTSLFGEKKMSY